MATSAVTNYDDRFDKIDAQFQCIDAQFQNVDAKFQHIDTRFENIEIQLEKMSEDFSIQFDKLTGVMLKGFDRINRVLETKADKLDLERAYDSLDSILKQQEIDRDERLVMGYQLERLDNGVHEIADKIGHRLSA